MAKKSTTKPTTPDAAKPSLAAKPTPAAAKPTLPAAKSKAAKPGTSKPAEAAPKKPGPASKPKKLEIAPIARQALMNSRLPRSPLDQAGGKRHTKAEIDAIRKFAVALAHDGMLSGDDDEDTVLICNRITEPAAIPITELLYDTCKWCEAEIYYDRLMPSPLGMVRVCVPCGIMLLEADKKGRN